MWVCPPVCVSHCSLFFFHWPPCHVLYSTSFYLHERCEFPLRPGVVSMVTAGHECVSCSVSSTEGEEMWPDVHVLIPSLPVWGDAAVWPSDQCLSDRRGTRERCNLWVTVSNRGIDEAESLCRPPMHRKRHLLFDFPAAFTQICFILFAYNHHPRLDL